MNTNIHKYAISYVSRQKTHLPQTKPCLFMNTWGPLDVATAGAAAMVKRCGVDQSCADGQSLSVTGDQFLRATEDLKGRHDGM